jgi:hypothetical protein
MAKCKRCKPYRRCNSHRNKIGKPLHNRPDKDFYYNSGYFRTFEEVHNDPKFQRLLRNGREDLTGKSKGTVTIVRYDIDRNLGYCYKLYCSDCGNVFPRSHAQTKRWLTNHSTDCSCHAFIKTEETVND